MGALIFSAVFVIVWFGAGIVTLHGALLGGNISFFQSVCVLGYCIFPLNLASLFCLAVYHKVPRCIVVTLMFAWSLKASVGFMAQLVPADRKALGVYPCILFFFSISWT